MENASTTKIDIHQSNERYVRRLESFKKDISINAENKKIILDFLRGCELGKISKKQCSPARLTKHICLLTRLNSIFGNKPFRKIIGKEIEDVVIKFNKGFYKRQLVQLKEHDGEKQLIKIQTNKSLADDTVTDFKMMIKRLFKFIHGEGDKYQQMAGWIRTEEKVKEVPALTREEVEKLADATNIRNRALILVMFDSGTRIEEFLNIRIGDLTKKQEAGRVYYQIRIKHSKTKPRTISIPMCTEVLEAWLSVHPDENNPQAQLFPATYDGVRVFLKELGRKIIKKDINPHLFRHSSATYYCNKLSQYQLCYRYGWSMTSKQPQRYIDREGINEQETAEVIQLDDMKELKKENKKLQESLELIKAEQERMGKESERRQKLDRLLNKVFTNKKLVKIFEKELAA